MDSGPVQSKVVVSDRLRELIDTASTLVGGQLAILGKGFWWL